MMELLILLLSVQAILTLNPMISEAANSARNDTGQDMYVINAMVYQVGIISNKTNQATQNLSNHENQEAFLFYPSSNSTTHLNVKDIPKPLVTEMTVQRFVGVAPLPKNTSIEHPPDLLPLTALQNMTLERLESLKNQETEKIKLKTSVDNATSSRLKTVENKQAAPLLPLNPFNALNNILN